MPTFYETTVHIGAADAGPYLQCRPSGVLNLLQEAATEAACAFHASGPEMYEKYHALWMVTRMWYHLERSLLWDEEVTIRTWHRADRGAMLYRDFDLFVGEEPVGEAVSAWVLVDTDSRRLLKMSRVENVMTTGGEELCKERKLAKLRLPERLELVEERRFHYSDIDCNGHVNNVRYADLAADAVGLENLLNDHFVSELQIGYLRECKAGERVKIQVGTEENGRFVRGVDLDGESRFEAHLTLDEWKKKS